MNKLEELHDWIDEHTGSGIVGGKLYANAFCCEPSTLKKKIIDLVSEQQKVKVPAFIAEWIETCKKYGSIVDLVDGTLDIKDEPDQQFFNWVNDNEHADVLVRAWLDGYEVEKKTKWVVLGKRGYLTSLSIRKGKSTGWTGNSDKYGSGAIHFEEEDIAQYTAYIVNSEVEPVEVAE